MVASPKDSGEGLADDAVKGLAVAVLIPEHAGELESELESEPAGAAAADDVIRGIGRSP